MNKTKLLFISPKSINARFIANDKLILQDHFDTIFLEVGAETKFGFAISLIKEFIFLLFNAFRYDLIYVWFADYHSLFPSFLAKLYNKKCIIVIGGYDADEILIGESKTIMSKLRKFCVVYSIKNSVLLLPVSKIIIRYLSSTVKDTKCELIYNGVDAETLSAESNFQYKENLIITVGGGGTFIKEANRKRLDFFIELGNEFNKRYPDFNAKFYLIGHNENTNTFSYLKPLIKSLNVELKPMTKTVEELINYYRKATVYMQLSYYESFGIAQAEAMLNGCIPVSNAGGAIPEVVGDAGFLIDGYDKEKYISTIKEILDKKHEHLRSKAKLRVLENFTLQIRKEKLLKALNSLNS